jgi:aminoglycoside phosphotransferase (APT) family kinase protein
VSGDILDLIPEPRRAVARTALTSAFGSLPIDGIQPVSGGASGALIYRVDTAARAYLLRIEARRSALRNPYQYVCMQTAADAGVAPPLVHVDDEAGVAIMHFLQPHPLAEYPGGAASLAHALGALAARLQTTPVFPAFADYFGSLARMLDYVKRSTVFAPGLLDPHDDAFQRIRERYRRDAAAMVSSHNDPNPRNIIFDGERLWLVDWETAQRNDPLTDIAILVDNLAPTPELEEILLTAWRGRPPTRALRARVTVMRELTRLYYAALGFAFFASVPRTTPPDDDLTAPTVQDFRAAVASGALPPASPQTLYVLGKMCLARFRATTSTAAFAAALSIASQEPNGT